MNAYRERRLGESSAERICVNNTPEPQPEKFFEYGEPFARVKGARKAIAAYYKVCAVI